MSDLSGRTFSICKMNRMKDQLTILSFDGTFDGLLTLVFESFRLKVVPDLIVNGGDQGLTLFDRPLFIAAEAEKAERVWKRVKERTSDEGAYRLYMVYLSEMADAPQLIYRYIRHMTESRHNIETDFAHPAVTDVLKIHRKVMREAHRIQMFTRFQQTAVNSYYASFAPKYNVLPVSIAHFRDRFAGQEWVIYDLLRNFGFHHCNGEIERISFEALPASVLTGNLDDKFLHPDEKQFRKLWKEYYHSISIENRKNPKLHRQLLPKRFWRYLPEKQ